MPWLRACGASRGPGDCWLRKKTQRWKDDGGEPEEMPTWPGCGTEGERRAEAHQCDLAGIERTR